MGSKLTDRTGSAVHRAKDRASDAAGSARSAAKDAGSSIAGKGSSLVGAVSDASLPSISLPSLDVRARQLELAGRAGRKLDHARSAAELSAERARHAAELRREKGRSRRARRGEVKAYAHAEKAQSILEERLAKAEKKLARVSHRRHRLLFLLIVGGGGAAAAVAARSRPRQQPTAEEIFPAAPGNATTPRDTHPVDPGSR
jgi:hypothetical protein